LWERKRPAPDKPHDDDDDRGGSRNFGKEGPVRGQSPEPSAEGASAGGGSGGRRRVWGPPPENFEKLDAISCNLAYIFEISMALDIIQNWAFAEQNNSSGHDLKPADIR